jgi:hypothetical protein
LTKSHVETELKYKRHNTNRWAVRATLIRDTY